MSNTTNPASSC